MKNKFLFAWILFHGLIFSAFLISLAVSPKITFATSLFDILPPSSALHEVQAADSKLAAKTGRAVTILVKADSFEKAKDAAQKFYFSYADSDLHANPDYFDSLSLFVDSASIEEITGWLHQNRFMLLDNETRQLLENGGAEELSEEALASVYGAFTFSDLSHLDEDPFLLSERNLRHFLEGGALSSTNMALRDDVLAAEKDGFWYVLVRGTVSESGSSITGKKSTVKSVYETTETLKRNFANDGTEVDFVFSGVPFHSFENASSAQRQISVISTVALILIALVFLWIFRSVVPAIVSVLAVLFSCGVGFVSVLLFFRGIHVLTFVFGTTLIGTCLDYSIHYFVNWKANPKCKNGVEVRRHIFRGITLGFVSTEICFLALFFAPFPLLKQVSVFLFTGLAASWLSVVALYPMIGKDSLVKLGNDRAVSWLFGRRLSLAGFNPAIFKIFPLILVIISLVVIFLNRGSFGIKNNIRELYNMSPEMLKNEITSAQVLNTGSSGWYFIVKADSEENLLQKNEELSDYLEWVLSFGDGSCLSVSQFIPSQKKQAQSYSAAKKMVELAPEQFAALGFDNPEQLALDYEENFRSAENSFVHAGDPNLPSVIKDAVSSLWIGEIDGSFYSCVMPLHLNDPKSKITMRNYAEAHKGIFYVDKVSDISDQLDVLSVTMLLMLAVAFVAVLVILCFCYKPRIVLKIAAIPLTVTLVTSAVLLLCKISLSFFPITAIVLVFGLGLDYIIYAIEGNKAEEGVSKINNFAILLSFTTTALSFGALALSTFPPVHTLGLTVAVGLTTAVVSAFCISKN